MTTPKQHPSAYVLVDTSSARVDRLWRAVHGRLQASARPRARRGVWYVPALALSVALAFGAGLLSRRLPESGWAKLATANDGVTVQLQDGSALTLGAQTSLLVREQAERVVELALELGRVECDVSHLPQRAFSVSAAGHAVLVKGTRFSVELSRERHVLAVEVQRGQVEIRRTGATGAEAVLGAGERWSVPLETSASTPQPPPAELPPSVDPSADVASSTTASAAPGVSAPAPAARSSADVSAAPPHRERAAPVPAESGARTLFDRGNAARRQGDLAGAAHAYEQLLHEYPADARAGLAGFELGRLRMDQFGDAPGAITPLQLAVRVVSEAGLREDALARLVHAFELTKELARCRAARAEYLEAYPKGTHVLAVVRSCGGE